MDTGFKIKDLRTKFGYTQLKLSELSGLSIRTIQRIENNEVNPSSYSLKILSSVFNEDLVTTKHNTKTTKFWEFIIPLNLNKFIQQLKDIDNKHIWISFIVGFCISFSIIIGDANDNLGLWLSIGITVSSLIWVANNYKELKKLKKKNS
jgi:transcriptional regulator with XRE-family HTH domain